MNLLINIYNLIEYYIIGDFMSWLVVVIAVSLSMDAFSLALAYGTLNMQKKDIILLSIIVGLYHFFMPIIGMFFGNKLLSIIPINPNLLVFIVLFIIGIEMIIESLKNNDKIKLMNKFEMIMFGLAVSLDSFSVGIGLNALSNNYIYSSIIFSLCSFLFTYFGLVLGKKISNIIGKISTLIGGIVLIIIGILYIL